MNVSELRELIDVTADDGVVLFRFIVEVLIHLQLIDLRGRYYSSQLWYVFVQPVEFEVLLPEVFHLAVPTVIGLILRRNKQRLARQWIRILSHD